MKKDNNSCSTIDVVQQYLEFKIKKKFNITIDLSNEINFAENKAELLIIPGYSEDIDSIQGLSSFLDTEINRILNNEIGFKEMQLELDG